MAAPSPRAEDGSIMATPLMANSLPTRQELLPYLVGTAISFE